MKHPLLQLLSSYNSQSHDRINWDDYFICQALLISYRSPSPKLQVGSIIIKNNRVISSGYNGYFSGAEHKSIYNAKGREINTIHAECNSICDAARRGVSLVESTIYITHFPCINCTKMIIACGIVVIKYLNDYNNDPVAIKLLKDANIAVIKL